MVSPRICGRRPCAVSRRRAGGLATAGRLRAHAGKEQGTHLDATAVTCFLLPSGLADIFGRVRCLSSRRPSARVARFSRTGARTGLHPHRKNDTHAVQLHIYIAVHVQTCGLATRTEPYRDPISGSADKISGGWMSNYLHSESTAALWNARKRQHPGGNLDATVELDLAVDAAAAVELRLETVSLDRLALRKRTQCQGEGEDRGGEDETFADGSDGMRPGGEGEGEGEVRTNVDGQSQAVPALQPLQPLQPQQHQRRDGHDRRRIQYPADRRLADHHHGRPPALAEALRRAVRAARVVVAARLAEREDVDAGSNLPAAHQADVHDPGRDDGGEGHEAAEHHLQAGADAAAGLLPVDDVGNAQARDRAAEADGDAAAGRTASTKLVPSCAPTAATTYSRSPS